MAFAKQLGYRYSFFRTIRQLLVWMILSYLRVFAKIALLFHKGTIVGIAGAVGKSTTRNALAAILPHHSSTIVIEGNSETGIPLGILGLSPGTYNIMDWIRIVILAPTRMFRLRKTTYLIVEMGIDGPHEPKNMRYLLSIIQPSVSVLLSESPAHVEHYETILPNDIKTQDEETQLRWITTYMLKDDGNIITTKAVQTAIVDATDKQTYEYAKNHVIKAQLFSAGDTEEHDIMLHFHEVTLEGTTFGFQVHTHQYKDYIKIFLKNMALPYETGGSLGCALLTAIHLGVTPEKAASVLQSSFMLPPGRSTLFVGKNDTVIIDSSYNASPASVTSFIHLLKSLKKTTKRKTVLILGDMKELGSYTEFSHRQIAKLLPEICDHVLLVGQFTKQFMLPHLEKHKGKFISLLSFADVSEVTEYLDTHPLPHTIMLIKGSQLLEEAIKPLLLHKKDTEKLCRQDIFWQKSKESRGLWFKE